MRKQTARTPAGKRISLPVLLAAALLLFLAALGSYFVVQRRAAGQMVSRGGAWESGVRAEEWGYRLELDGQRYVRRDGIKTYLFLGVDKQDADAEAGENGRADIVLLCVLDTQEKTLRLLNVPRDSIVPVDVYDEAGRKLDTGESRLCLQYSYGDSDRRGGFLVKRRVSELIHGIPLDGVVSLTLDGIPPILDKFGGLSVTIPRDYTAVDPAYTAGAAVTLDGAAAARFLRSRDPAVPGSSAERVNRQNWFMQELLRQTVRGKLPLSGLLDLAGSSLTTDLSAGTMLSLRGYRLKEPVLEVPGASIPGGEYYDDFRVDEAALRTLLLDLFYVPES